LEPACLKHAGFFVLQFLGAVTNTQQASSAGCSFVFRNGLQGGKFGNIDAL
jgi:hypothetical protein